MWAPVRVETSLWCLLGPHKTLSAFIAQTSVSQVMLKFWWCGGRLTWCLLDSSPLFKATLLVLFSILSPIQVSTIGSSTSNASHEVVLVWQNLDKSSTRMMWLDIARNIVPLQSPGQVCVSLGIWWEQASVPALWKKLHLREASDEIGEVFDPDPPYLK